jgi:hypothetical protein
VRWAQRSADDYRQAQALIQKYTPETIYSMGFNVPAPLEDFLLYHLKMIQFSVAKIQTLSDRPLNGERLIQYFIDNAKVPPKMLR